MGRPLRIEYEGAWYHVMNRGRGRQAIFPGEAGYEAFLETVAEACRRFRLEVHAYCLMPNHYHLLVRTPLANLGRAMRHIDGVYTQRHNRLAETDGPLFRGRYKAILVDADAYLLAVSRYIHRNPIDGARPLVEDLADWPWSSYPAFINRAKAPGWLTTDTTYAMLGKRNRYAAYRHFVEAGVEEEVARFYANQRATPVLGEAAFRAWAFEEGGEAAESPRWERQRLHSADEVLAAVAAEWGVRPKALTVGGRQLDRQTRQARQVAMLLCRDCTELTLAAIGQRFGGIHYSAVGQNVRRVREAMEKDRGLARSYETVRSRLDP
ncbi:MAG: transposase [Thiohalorhabdus sp.]|uniref:helix-turn-helix domain-containing protein n=1 Tax=Thiohalorhabdus sp. TaxID=3094134 RepID=UPI002FC3915E